MLVKAEKSFVMWYLTLGNFTWNISWIVFCVLSVAAVHGFLGIALKAENIFTFPYRWLQIIIRIAFCEAVVAMFVLAVPEVAGSDSLKNIIGAYALAVTCIIISYIVVVMLAIFVEQLIEWIFRK